MPKVNETPELVGVSNADLLPPPPVPVVAANVALKLPVFWPKAAEVWFAQADAQIAIKSITVSKWWLAFLRMSLHISLTSFAPLRLEILMRF